MTNAPIDTTVITELEESIGSDFMVELVDTFLDEAPTILAELSAGLDAHDMDQFRRAAHSIKSNADVFGALDLAERARQLELSGPQGDPEELGASLDKLNAAYAEAAAALKAFAHG